MKKGIVSKIVSFVLAVALIAGLAMSMPGINASAKEDDKWKFINIDEQRAVNLTARDLINWANYYGYNYSYEIVNNNGKQELVVYVIHEDGYGNAIKALKDGGKKAVENYVSGLKQAAEGYIFSGTDRNFLDYIDVEATEEMLSGDSLLSVGATMYDAYSTGKAQVVSVYYYSDINYAADKGYVYMLSSGRFYGISQGYNNLVNGTNNGFSVKAPTKTKLGYYYKQDKVKINGDKYWKIEVKPY